MKIKDKYKGKTIVVYDSVLGDRKIVVDEIKTERYNYYVTMGLGYLFEKPVISYTGIEQETAQADAVEEPTPVKLKKTRKRKK